MGDEHEGWHEITVATPLPMGVAGALMQLIGTAWPEAVIKPSKKGHFIEPAFTMLVPPSSDPTPVSAERAAEIRLGSEEAMFNGFRIDDEDYAWVGTAPPKELSLFLGTVAHQIFTAHQPAAINYVEWEVTMKDGTGQFLLCIADRTGKKAKTPHTLRLEAEAERDEIKAAFIELYKSIDGVADEMSQRDHELIERFWPLFERLEGPIPATSEEDA